MPRSLKRNPRDEIPEPPAHNNTIFISTAHELKVYKVYNGWRWFCKEKGREALIDIIACMSTISFVSKSNHMKLAHPDKILAYTAILWIWLFIPGVLLFSVCYAIKCIALLSRPTKPDVPSHSLTDMSTICLS